MERIGEDAAEEDLFRCIWEEGDDREFVVDALKAECEVGMERQEDCFP